MLSINTNLSSLIAQRAMQTSTDRLNQAVERMSTGFKINHAKDNAANYSISTNLTTKINAYQIAEDNVAMGMDMLTTADENLSLISDKLIRLRDLATQASNGTYGTNSLNAINGEANALVDEINRLYTTAEYNGMKLFQTEEATPTRLVVDETKRVSKISGFVEGETYFICDSTDLLSMSELMKDIDYQGTSNVTFELASNIDMSGHVLDYGMTENNPFEGIFHGNGYTISNLETSGGGDYGGAFFNDTDGAIIDSLILKDITVSTGTTSGCLISNANNTTVTNCAVVGAEITNLIDCGDVGGLIGRASNTDIINCYVSDTYIESNTITGNAGGIVAYVNGGSKILNCYVDSVTIFAEGYCGGIAGEAIDIEVSNCYATYVDIHGNESSGGLFGVLWSSTMNNCCVYSLDNEARNGIAYGAFVGEIYDSTGAINAYCTCCEGDAFGDSNNSTVETIDEDGYESYRLEEFGYTEANGWVYINNRSFPVLAWQFKEPGLPIIDNPNGTYSPSSISLQIGINSNESSNITVNIGFALNGANDLRGIGQDTTIDFLTQLDGMLATVNAKQVEYGSAQNRLESALDEISTQYENLVSSRSTLRDADIAEVSAEYIQQQILQQAAATLMSTANQSPAIALQLI